MLDERADHGRLSDAGGTDDGDDDGRLHRHLDRSVSERHVVLPLLLLERAVRRALHGLWARRRLEGSRVVASVALAARGRASGGALFGLGALGGHLLGHGEAATQRQRGSDPQRKVGCLHESNPPARASAGKQHSVFIDGEGRLSSCGSAEEVPGLLGHGKGVMRLNTPTRLPSTLGGERAVSVSAGSGHSLALTAGGSVLSWGDGLFRQLGHGDAHAQWQPKKVEALAGQRVVAVSAGEKHSLALSIDGAVWSWGHGLYGQLGHGNLQNQLLPKKVEALAGQRIVALSAGEQHSFALAADGAVWSWGHGGFGILGHGDQQSQLLPKKVEAFAGQRVVSVSAGEYHSIALTADGAVWSWGGGSFGRLGHGDQPLTQLLPMKVEALASQHVVAVSERRDHNLALTADDALWSWGGGSRGQLGHGDDQPQLLPKKVEAFAGQRVVAVSAGAYHSLTLTADGAFFTWGQGEDGCLGHGEDLSNQLLPKKVEAWAPGQ